MLPYLKANKTWEPEEGELLARWSSRVTCSSTSAPTSGTSRLSRDALSAAQIHAFEPHPLTSQCWP